MKYKSIVPLLMKISDFLPRRHAIRDRQGLEGHAPFFVFGSGRNGSTMLSAMLDAHSQIVVPTEQFRLPNVIIKFKLMNFLEWRDLVSIAVSEFTANEGAINWDLPSAELLTKLYHLPKKEQSLERLIQEIYWAYGQGQKTDFAIWGDKTPRNTFYLKYIFQVFPHSKYIFLLRDGRGVVSSWIKRDKTDDIQSRADAWNFSAKMYRWMQRKAPERLLTVRYEELVAEPQKILTGICEFLGFSYEPGMLQFQSFTKKLGDDIVEGSNFQKVGMEVNTGSLGKWKEELSPQQIVALNKMMGTNLKAFGYEG